MSPTSRDDAVEAVRTRTDIVETIGRYLRLKKAGNRYVGLCPFHAEKAPSFSVNPRLGLFHCFGCKASGDVFTFLMRMEGKTFPEALEQLAEQAGVALPTRRQSDPVQQQRKQRLLEVLEQATRFFEDGLWSAAGQQAQQYLRARGLDQEVARRFRLGYAPPGWHNLGDQLKRLGISNDEALEIGLLVRGGRGPYDMFRNRLVFPIVGLDDKVRGFGARNLDDEQGGAKYINSPQGPLFDKSGVLYGLSQARQAIRHRARALLVEGYFDVLSLVAAGVAETVATCGTALSEGHAGLLKRFSDRVVTVFDADDAGLKATFRASEALLGRNVSPYALCLPSGEDPDSFVRKFGSEAFERLLTEAKPVVDVLSDRLASEAGTDVEARTHAVRQLEPLIHACGDGVRRSGYVRLLAERFRIDEGDLRRGLTNARRARRSGPQDAVASEGRGQRPAIPAEELRCLALVLQHPTLLSALRESDLVGGFRSPAAAGLARRFLAADRDESLAVLFAKLEDEELKERLSAELVRSGDLTPERARSDLDLLLKKIRIIQLMAEQQQLQERCARSLRAGQQQEYRRLRQVQIHVARELKSIGLAVKPGDLG